MIHAVILTHGRIGEEILNIAQVIGGPAQGIDSVSLLMEDSPLSFEDKVRGILKEKEDNLLILADIYGGTPCNVALSLLRTYDASIVTGVSLAMVLELLTTIQFVETAQEMAGKLLITVKETSQLINRSSIGGDNADEADDDSL